MTEDNIANNAAALNAELGWFSEVLDTRLKLYFGQDCEYQDISEVTPPTHEGSSALYAHFISYYKLSAGERLVLMLALVPHIKPHLLDVFFLRNSTYDRRFTEFGGLAGAGQTGFIPTGETALFVLAGDEVEQRIAWGAVFDGEHVFSAHNILRLEPVANNESYLAGMLTLSREFIDYFTTGKPHRPSFSIDFPAKHITTDMDWSDLVLENHTMEQLEEIKAWIDHGHILMNDWGLKKKLKPGYKALFHGPPGTGKTLTACLLGKYTGRDVYRIDLSMVISKYIGETEKNLSRVFDMAEHKNWILFFDEADALFGKRTKVEDSHDRYANQEVSFLLQRIEDFEGVTILASNFRTNLDEAFTRRFQSVIGFPMPRREERLKLWSNAFAVNCDFEEKLNFIDIADKFEISGGAMMNVVRYCSLKAVTKSSNTILLEDVLEGIRKEFRKEGRTTV